MERREKKNNVEKCSYSSDEMSALKENDINVKAERNKYKQPTKGKKKIYVYNFKKQIIT